MLAGEVNYAVYVTLEGWAVDVVRGEHLLRLRGVVELFDEEVRDGVMRQARDSWRGGSIRKKRTSFAGAVIFDL